jgi:hypothetical protein
VCSVVVRQRSVDGIRDVAECGRGLLVVRVYESFFIIFFMYRIEHGWVGLFRGVGRGYTGVALHPTCAGGRGRWVWLGRCSVYLYTSLQNISSTCSR